MTKTGKKRLNITNCKIVLIFGIRVHLTRVATSHILGQALNVQLQNIAKYRKLPTILILYARNTKYIGHLEVIPAIKLAHLAYLTDRACQSPCDTVSVANTN